MLVFSRDGSFMYLFYQMNDEVKYVDSLIQLLMDGLLRNNLHSCVNIMIVSDHGNTNTASFLLL